MIALPTPVRVAFSLLVLAFAPVRAATATGDFDQFVETFAADWMRANPASATASQYFDGDEQDTLDRQLTAADIDAAARQLRVERAQAGLARLKTFAPAALTPSQRVSHAVLTWRLQDALQVNEFTDHRFVFEQFDGLQVGLINFLSQSHPIRHARDVENYVVRLSQVARLIDDGIAEAKARADRGIIPPKFILKSTIDGLDRFLAPEPGENVLVASLMERAAGVTTLTPDARSAAVATATNLVHEEIRPAFERIRRLLAAQMETATDDAGLWRLPRGGAAYAAALRTNTTTDLTPEQVHELGRQEVARIENKMDGLLRQLGYTEGTVLARYQKLDADAQPPAEPDPRPAMIARFDEILRDAEKRAASVFDLRPKAPVVVKREPLFTEKSAAAHYSFPAPDGTRPGVFWVPLPGPVFRMLYMRTLTYHEGVPGHHFQVALQQELPEIPRFRQRRVFGLESAFAEGWGLYAEQLAVELGWYEGDLRGQLGQLDGELFRARRLVVDTGLHAMKWTRQQAIDYGIAASEVERYVVMPGQACSYKIGQLKLLEVRAKAQRALGAKFSLKEFHNVVLRTGAVPLEILETVIDAWIASEKARL